MAEGIRGQVLTAGRTALLPFVCLLAGCTQQAPQQAQKPANAIERSGISRDELWNRRRQCAAAIDEVLKHTGWDKSGDSGFSRTSVASHYNESKERCYVRIDIVNKSGGNRSQGIPFTTYVIVDAFDDGTTLSCSEESAAGFCSVDEPGKETVSGDCVHCRAVAKELMTK
jgi:hypothetical protein